MLNQNLIFYPCFALILLTGIVLLRMFAMRLKSIKEGSVDFRHFKTYNTLEKELPPLMVQASRNFTNLFEVPTLFYVVCLFALITGHVDILILSLAWAYVAFRCIHSMIHLTINKIMPRMLSYTASWLILIAMSLVLAVRLI